ncbi:MAG: ABC transporter permease [Aquisalimonadaceae bacterium]
MSEKADKHAALDQRAEQPRLGGRGVIVRGRGAGRKRSHLKAQQILRTFSPVLLLVIWELASRLGLIDRLFFPPPTEIAESGYLMFLDGSLVSASADSLRRLFIGYGMGALAGVAIGLWLGLSSWSRALFEPWIQITYPIPKLAVYPLIVLVVGLGDLPIIILLAIAVFYIVVINTIAGVLSINRAYLDVGRDCNASFAQFAGTIALPAALPHIFTGLEIALGIGFIVLVAGEFVGSNSGLGSLIWQSWQVFDVGPMYVAIVVVSLLGYASVLTTRLVGSILMPWQRSRDN